MDNAIRLPKQVLGAKLTHEEYSKRPGVRKTWLDHINRSPLHLKNYIDNPPEQTAAMRFGSLCHDAILQPEILGQRYAIKPEYDGRTTVGKAIKAEFESGLNGREIITQDEADQVLSMIEQIQKHPIAKSLLRNGVPELAYFWQDSNTKLECKCKPDVVVPHNRILVDLKTTEDASFKGFQRSIANYRYDVQAAYYLDGVTAMTGDKYESFILIAIEKKAPYAVAIYALDDASIECGRMKYRANLETYKKCLDTNQWPGYESAIQSMNLPSWAWLDGE